MTTSITLTNLKLSRLKNATFTDIMFRAGELLSSHTAITTAMPQLTSEFSALINKLNKTLVAEKGSTKTERLREMDRKRDDAHRGLHSYVKAYTYHADAAVSEAAEKILHVIKRFGTSSLRNASYADESALLIRLMEELDSAELSDAKAKLGEITIWTSALDTAMINFEEVINERFEENAASLGYTTFDVRKEISPVFRNLIQACETFAMLNTDPEYGQFITELNARIEYLNLG